MFCHLLPFSSSPQHHCRKCGAVVCGVCSNRKFLIPYQAERPLRVCISCFDALTAAQAEAERYVSCRMSYTCRSPYILSLPPSHSDLDHHLRPLLLPPKDQSMRYVSYLYRWKAGWTCNASKGYWTSSQNVMQSSIFQGQKLSYI